MRRHPRSYLNSPRSRTATSAKKERYHNKERDRERESERKGPAGRQSRTSTSIKNTKERKWKKKFILKRKADGKRGGLEKNTTPNPKKGKKNLF